MAFCLQNHAIPTKLSPAKSIIQYGFSRLSRPCVVVAYTEPDPKTGSPSSTDVSGTARNGVGQGVPHKSDVTKIINYMVFV